MVACTLALPSGWQMKRSFWYKTLLYGYLSALLLSAVIVALILFVVPGDAWYTLSVENRSKGAVVLYVDEDRPDLEDKIIEGCSTRNLGQVWFRSGRLRPGHVVKGEVRGIDGRHILTIEESPELREFRKGSSAWYLEVVVPGATDDEC